jgi:FkbM family methyltransferase
MDYLALRHLQRRARTHLAAGEPQLAIFAFEHVGQHIELSGAYEKDELEALFSWVETVTPGVLAEGVALDVGANVGNHAVRFSRKFKQVTAFEPVAETFSLLSHNARMVKNLRCHQVAISDADGSTQLRVDAANRGASRIDSSGGSELETVVMRRLDSFAEECRNVRLIKIDVEGHEAAVIDGAREIIARDRPLIVLEAGLGGAAGGTSCPLRSLREAGYEAFFAVVRRPDPNRHSNPKIRLLRDLFHKAFVGTFVDIIPVDAGHKGFYHMVVAAPQWFCQSGRPS